MMLSLSPIYPSCGGDGTTHQMLTHLFHILQTPMPIAPDNGLPRTQQVALIQWKRKAAAGVVQLCEEHSESVLPHGDALRQEIGAVIASSSDVPVSVIISLTSALVVLARSLNSFGGESRFLHTLFADHIQALSLELNPMTASPLIFAASIGCANPPTAPTPPTATGSLHSSPAQCRRQLELRLGLLSTALQKSVPPSNATLCSSTGFGPYRKLGKVYTGRHPLLEVIIPEIPLLCRLLACVHALWTEDMKQQMNEPGLAALEPSSSDRAALLNAVPAASIHDNSSSVGDVELSGHK